MAVGQRRCPDLGKPLTAHWKALPARQQVLLTEGRLSLPEMVRAFEQKYPKHNDQGAIRALTFFDDVEGDMPIMLAPTTWKKVTTDLARLARRYSDRAYRTFTSLAA